MLIVAIGVGLLIGLTMGALGGGGSILTVPALVYLVGLDTRAATTGSLVIVGVTALFAMAAHLRHGRVRVLQGVVFGLIGVAGAVAGTRLSLAVPPEVLLASFSALLLVVAAAMVTRGRVAVGGGTDRGGDNRDRNNRDGDDGHGADKVGADGDVPVPLDVPIISFTPRFVCACPRAAKVVVAATAVGLMTGFFGVGGGFLVVPALVLALDFSMPVAIGTSLLVISINSATALTARIGQDFTIDWPIIATFAAASVIGSLGGSRIAGRMSPGTLRIAFAVLITVVGLYTAARSIPGLFA